MASGKPLDAQGKEGVVVMGRYMLAGGGDSVVLGEGTWSICRRGTVISSGEPVAIKVYKATPRGSCGSTNSKSEAIVQQKKFLRQVQVLRQLQEPFQVPADPRLWNEELAKWEPASLFMKLVDFSKNDKGEASVDETDGARYIITELGSCSLHDYLKSRRRPTIKQLSKTAIGNIVCAMVRVVAGLHAKGLVHLDLKPENLMLFESALKLIDVDGCVPIGTRVSVDDSSLSFSPCYCAPEWARFLINDSEEKPTLVVHPGLDVWSVGLVAWELVSLEAAMKPVFRSFVGHGRAANQATFFFLEWLSLLNTVTIPDAMREFDMQFADILLSNMLVCDPTQRKSLAESLSHPYIVNHMNTWEGRGSTLGVDGVEQVPARRRFNEDTSSKALQKGALWKLQAGGDKSDLSAWKLRDVWVAVDGSLCYFSIREDKRLVLLNGHQLHAADVLRLDGSAKPHAFQVRLPGFLECDVALACESDEELFTWTDCFDRARASMLGSIHLGTALAIDVRQFMLAVRNRRKKLEMNRNTEAGAYQQLYKGKLKKLISGGDASNADAWREREMWVTKNGSFVYWSVKDFSELIYYTAEDIHCASLVVLDRGSTMFEWAFQICPAATEDGIQFSPGTFAADSEEERTQWTNILQAFTRSISHGKLNK